MRECLVFLCLAFAFSTMATELIGKSKNASGEKDSAKKNGTNTSGAVPMAQAMIPRKILFAWPDKITVRLNHAGDRIAYISRRENDVAIVVEDLHGRVIREFTVKAARNLAEFSWSAQDDYIFILQDTNGNENNHIVALNLHDGSQKDLTPFDNSRAELVTNNLKDKNEIIIRCNKRNPQWMDVYRLNFVTGEMTLLFENNKYAEMLFDENLTLRVATAVTADGGTDVFIFKDGKPDLWKHISFEDSFNSKFVIQDVIIGDNWYYLSSEGRDKNALISHNLKNGTSEELFTNEQADVQDILFDRTTQKPLITEVEYLKPELFSHDSKISKHLKFLQSRFKQYSVKVKSMSASGATWIVAVESSTEMPKYYIYNTLTQELRFLFHSQESLSRYAFHEMQPVVIKSRDGLDLVCYLTQASEKSSKLIMYIHGGPWWRDVYGFDKTVQFLANRGYSVLQVNYRGSIGLGKKFCNAINMHLDKVRNDIIDAANWAVENGIAKPDQIGIMGKSFGGYSTLAGLTFTPDFFCCGVDVVGPSNWETVFSKVPEYWKPYMIGWYKCAGDPQTEEGRKTLKKNSPITFVKNIKKPLIVFQGEHDPRVNKYESELIVSEMKKRDIPVTYVMYPDEGHGFLKEANNISYLALTEKFLSKVFGGWYEPIGADELEESSHKIIENGGL